MLKYGNHCGCSIILNNLINFGIRINSDKVQVVHLSNS